MATCRALTNMLGNAVATVVVGQWVGAVDKERMHGILDGSIIIDDPEQALLAADAEMKKA
jgi:aerobic C4-dicarboxylate transport protein